MSSEQWRLARRLSVVLVGLLVIGLSLAPLAEAPAPDKLLHMLAYGAWALPISVSRRTLGRIGSYLAIILIVGGVIEIVQPYVGREGSLADFLANLLGIGFGAAGGLGIRSCRLRRPPLSRK